MPMAYSTSSVDLAIPTHHTNKPILEPLSMSFPHTPQKTNLNPAQQQAVKYIDGPLLVIAGAGSGKTKVITEKINYLIHTCQIKPQHIFAITFTNKAASEMRTRLGKILGKNNSGALNISTFHTLGLNILRKNPEKLGLKQNFTLLDDQDSLGIIRSLTESHISLDKSEAEKIAQGISQLKSNLISPEQALSQIQKPYDQVIATFYQRYNRQLRAFNAVDFDDLITLPVQLLKNHPEAKNYWQSQVHYLLVDEYQDTNQSQYELVKLLVEERQAFTAVGDDDQSIYAWRGAKPENLNLLKLDFPRLKIILLEQNYRSTQYILSAANTLINHNTHLINKTLRSELGLGERIKIIHCPDENTEAERIISEIISHQFQHQVSYSHYAILYRGNHQAAIFEKTLQLQRIPYKISGSLSIFSRAEVKDVLAFCKLISNPNDDIALLRVINIPKREIGPTTLEKLGLYSRERNQSFFLSMTEFGFSQQVSPKILESIKLFAQFISKHHLLIKNKNSNQTFQNLLENFLEDLDYYGYLSTLTQDEVLIKKRYDNCLLIILFIQNIAQDSPDLSLSEILNKLMISEAEKDKDQDENSNNKVSLSTLHAAKGLEFPHVFLTGMEEGNLPHQASIDSNQIEEERRLAYVGITRAELTLTMTLCTTRTKFREKIKTMPSRFLKELPEEALIIEGKAPENQDQQQALNQSKLSALRERFIKN